MVQDRVGPGGVSKKLSSVMEKFLFGDQARLFRDRMTAASVALDILGLKSGDTAIMSPLGSLSLAMALVSKGISIIFSDVSRDTPVLDSGALAHTLRQLPTPPKLIIADCPFGFLPDMRSLLTFNIPILEDLRWGFGGYREMELAGARTSIALVSLEEDGLICAGGGELLVVRGKALSPVFKNLVQSFPKDVFLSDLNAALGLSQFNRRDEMALKRRELYRRWFTSLRKGSGTAFKQEGEADPVLSFFPLCVESGLQDVLAYARKKGVECDMAFTQAAAALFPEQMENMNNARDFQGRCILFPLHTAMSASDQKTVLSVLGTLP